MDHILYTLPPSTPNTLASRRQIVLLLDHKFFFIWDRVDFILDGLCVKTSGLHIWVMPKLWIVTSAKVYIHASICEDVYKKMHYSGLKASLDPLTRSKKHSVSY